jgi:hypothetical protein
MISNPIPIAAKSARALFDIEQLIKTVGGKQRN